GTGDPAGWGLGHLQIVTAGFLGLGCGLTGSALSRSVLSAVGWSFVAAAVNAAAGFTLYWLVFWTGELALSYRNQPEAVEAEYAAGAVMAVAALALPFLFSMWVYT